LRWFDPQVDLDGVENHSNLLKILRSLTVEVVENTYENKGEGRHKGGQT